MELADGFRIQARCIQGVPAFMRSQFRAAMRVSLKRLHYSYGLGDENVETRAWKLFWLTSRMLLWRSQARAPIREELEKKMTMFHKQEWAALIREARAAGSVHKRPRRSNTAEEEAEARAKRAETCVRRGEVSSGRQPLCAAVLAPGTPAVFRELRDPARCPSCLLRLQRRRLN